MVRAPRVIVVGCLALLIAAPAAAELGTFSFSYSVTPVGVDRIDFTLTASTSGATFTYPFETVRNWAYLYGPTGPTAAPTSSNEWAFRSTATTSPGGGIFAMALVSNFSFTGLAPGTYWYIVEGGAYGIYSTSPTTITTFTYDTATGSLLLGSGGIPTAGLLGLMLLGLALATSGVILLRRT